MSLNLMTLGKALSEHVIHYFFLQASAEQGSEALTACS